MFLLLVHYKKPLEIVDQFLQPHVEFLNKYYLEKKFIFSGRRTPRTGGVILANVFDKTEVNNIISQDPFHIEGIAEYEIIEFTPTMYDPSFEIFVINDI